MRAHQTPAHNPKSLQVRYRWAWCKHLSGAVWGPADRPDWKAQSVPAVLGGDAWAGPEFDSDDLPEAAGGFGGSSAQPDSDSAAEHGKATPKEGAYAALWVQA